MFKKVIFLMLLATLSCFAVDSSEAAPDPGGFLGLKWSQPVADCKKQGICSDETLAAEDQINGETVYRGAPETLAGVPLTFSSLAFYGNKFYLGTAVFRPQDSSYENMKNSLIREYGKPKKDFAKGANWQVGNTKVALYKGESLCGVVYAHAPTFANVAKIKKYPSPAPATQKAPPKK
jgi:hypothetical protein